MEISTEKEERERREDGYDGGMMHWKCSAYLHVIYPPSPQVINVIDTDYDTKVLTQV
jgi:hypothetical protein